MSDQYDMRKGLILCENIFCLDCQKFYNDFCKEKQHFVISRKKSDYCKDFLRKSETLDKYFEVKNGDK